MALIFVDFPTRERVAVARASATILDISQQPATIARLRNIGHIDTHEINESLKTGGFPHDNSRQFTLTFNGCRFVDKEGSTAEFVGKQG